MLADHMKLGVQSIQLLDDIFEALKIRSVLDSELLTNGFMMPMALSQRFDLILINGITRYTADRYLHGLNSHV